MAGFPVARSWGLALLNLFPLLAGCRGQDASPPGALPPKVATKAAETAKSDERQAAGSSTTYTLSGVVRSVNKTSGIVTIRHERIPGFMEAMTMPFDVKGQDVLEELAPGDEVEGKLRVVRVPDETGGEVVKDYRLEDLAVTRPAPAPSLRLNLSGGTPTVEKARAPCKPGDPVPDFAMTTQDGSSLRLSDLRGKVVALTFIYTRCPLPDFCPLMDRKFSQLADRLAAIPGRAEHVRLLSVSFDPEHDTPDVLRRHAALRGAKPPLWTFAVASHAELARVGPALGLTYGPTADEIVHNLSTAVIDPSGRLARLETGPSGKTWKPSELLTAIYSLIPPSGK